MSKVGSWSTTAGSNNATPPDGWPEGQAPSTVNDCAREMMAQIKTLVNSLEYVDLNNTPSFLTTTTFSLATTDATTFEVGRRVKLFDTTTLYGTIDSVSATFVSVRLDSGVLSTSLSSVAVAIVKATNNSLPDIVYRRQNPIINGSLNVWQRGASFTAMANTTFMADRFFYEQSNAASVNSTKSNFSANASNVPTLAQVGSFLTNSLLISVSAADAAVAAGDYALITTVLEGGVWQPIAHKPLTLSFWVNTNRSGTYCCALRNNGGAVSSVSMVQNYTISTINTWQKVALNFAAPPTAPYTWNYDAGAGLRVSWALMAGTTYQATVNQWTAMNALATSSQTNLLASAGNVFAIAGIQLHEGLVDLPFEPIDSITELQRCQRYYEAGQTSCFYVPTVAPQEFRYTVPFKTSKRSAGTITITNGTVANIQSILAVNAKADGFDLRVIASLSAVNTSSDGTTWTCNSDYT